MYLFCVKCGLEIQDGLRMFDFCPKCGTKLQKIGDNDFEENCSFDYSGNDTINGDAATTDNIFLNKHDAMNRAVTLSKIFNASVFLKIIGLVLKIICLPLIPVFFILGYFFKFVAFIGYLAVGLFILFAALMFIIGIFTFLSDHTQTKELIVSLIVGITFSIISLTINLLPLIFNFTAKFLTYFVFGIKSYEDEL